MSALIIFEILVIPAIITYLLIALLIVEWRKVFSKKQDNKLKEETAYEKVKANKTQNRFYNNKFNHIDFSGGNIGI